ncbi:hypothetical protein EN836_26650 [Mesorhizobium sp. M1C.F.Ca.ET.193.01.1.1]|nr:hypothetical protein EN853_26645 [Mesorhizobium sp. M1C.F.Ca.ET.210.01.1.1]TGQ66439.1 hypothetical protein EN855_026655 [Mesorhizobium sp. M1C.F.Ca.ET.212.01.1.1]TGR00525.1 hypothetical protein EN847_26645 [Mesorhizobium sp. M1C.F.Ca.ET.204.01.1.1]TGR21116.1 hypothetical protein EN839_26645 [Mesorhizobium sp. M1C.F.Ca.ET.196.01.1.1]TGR43834.1 hypothetical protein EN838_26645 [Mesorhizobium sp. M1C.F.Ca.ET.195.01.1.1]TGR61975.1 hypothetical protein EN835_026640 [Mesorhizobium sp. M1C.F.Ca.ET
MARRPFPSQEWRLAVAPGFANRQRWTRSEAPKLLISPEVGEMSGRTEGGAVPPAPPVFPPS